MSYRKFISGLLFGLVAALGSAQAQQATKIVVPFAAGGGTDQYVPHPRGRADQARARRSSSTTSPAPAASSPPTTWRGRARTGYTVLVSSLGTLANNTVLYEKLPYDPNKDFAPVSQIAYQPAIIVGRADLPYKNIKRDGGVRQGQPRQDQPRLAGRGHPDQPRADELREESVGISTTHIPFNGDAPAVQALLGGQIDIHGTSITGSLPHIRSGKLRVLGVMDSRTAAAGAGRADLQGAGLRPRGHAVVFALGAVPARRRMRSSA